MQAIEKPWFESFKTMGIGLADTLNESVQMFAQAKLGEELARHTQKQAHLDASKNQEVNAAIAPDKGRDADGTTITEETVASTKGKNNLPFGITETQLKYIGGGAAVLLLGAITYKAVK